MVTNMGENRIIRVTSMDPSDPFVKDVHTGQLRMEGKDYVMQDGDVVEFRFNV